MAQNHVVYTKEQLADAKKLAKAIVSVPEEKRNLFDLAIEAMIVGAELAESNSKLKSEQTKEDQS